MSSENYKLIENINIIGTSNYYNVYITSKDVFFISLDNKNYSNIFRVLRLLLLPGLIYLFGALLGFIIWVPAAVALESYIKKISSLNIERLRGLSVKDLGHQQGYGSAKKYVTFEYGINNSTISLGDIASFKLDTNVAKKIKQYL